nr:hypothetical protein OG781_01670 [Streptomyces sp. NBC_00830]WTB35628.1 hypothetical protein OG781_44910 [Streptomyces sp. NBC_00830]
MTPHLMIEQLKSVVPERIGMILDEDPAARAAQRRAEDAALVERLRLTDFEGLEMELARERLWAYAVVTLNAWCASGTIVERVRASSDFHGGFEMQDNSCSHDSRSHTGAAAGSREFSSVMRPTVSRSRETSGRHPHITRAREVAALQGH